ncbi:Nicotinate-nucleotide adenylyltransferase [subsurface metagenome]
MNIGVLGGTFDPIHIGHLVVAEEVRARLNLAEILFVPAGQPWLKANLSIAPATHRIQMVRLAIADKPCFKLAAMEVGRPGPSYTVDTIDELQAQLGIGDELFFILGWDNLAELPQWRQPSRLIRMCRLVAVPRPDYPLPDLKALEASIPGLSQRVILLDEPKVDISAFAIRNRVARGLSIHHLVPEPVDKYIKQHKLYLM